jgi:tetratricopeptide (TPR) repeat protein
MQARLDAADGKLDAALASVKAAEAVDPTGGDAAYLEGQIHLALRDTTKAVQALERAWSKRPPSPAAALAIADIRLGSGDRLNALEWAEQARRAHPNAAAPRLTLVRALLANRQLDRALVEAAALAQAWPRVAAVHSQLGAVHAVRGDTAAARRAYAAALDLDRTSPEALAGLSMLDIRDGRPREAQARIDARLKDAPDSVPLLLLSARTALASGSSARAEAALKRIIEIDPANMQAFEFLGQLYIREGRLDAARDQFAAIARGDERAVGARTMIAMILEAQHRRGDAVREYEQILASHPAAGVAANNLAWLYAEDERLDDALQLAQVARRELGRLPQAIDTLAWIYLKKKQPLDAIPLLAECVEAQPDNPTYAYHLAVAYRDAGYTARAREAVTAALTSPRAFPARNEAVQLSQQVALERANDRP